jgi:hypothetical protein
MDQNEKVSNDKITRLENEIKVLKNEVQAVLLDLRESYLNMENPFNTAAAPATVQPIVITERASNHQSRPEPAVPENPKPEAVKPEEKALAERPAEPEPEIDPIQSKIQAFAGSHSVRKAPAVCPGEVPAQKNGKLDIVTVAGLASWVEESTRRLGKEKSAAVLDMSQAMGYLAEDIKPILANLIELSPSNTGEIPTGTWSYLESLMKINNLLSHDNRDDLALQLLSRVSGEAQHG